MAIDTKVCYQRRLHYAFGVNFMPRKAVGEPILFFGMPVDQKGGQVISGLNRGRLSLWDDLGLVGRWVFTSSFDGRQSVNDWNVRGGIIPPNFTLSGQLWYSMGTKLIQQPGQPVAEGFIIYYKGSNTWITDKGVTRSEIMLHGDTNWQSSPGSYGCLVALPEEYSSFKKDFLASCGHLEKVRLGVTYTY